MKGEQALKKNDEFLSRFTKLNVVHANIVFDFLRRMEHNENYMGMNNLEELKNVKKHLKNILENTESDIKKPKNKKNKGMSFYELHKKVIKIDAGIEINALRTTIMRNTKNSVYYEPIAKALGITENELFYGENLPKEMRENINIMAEYYCSVQCLFNSLSKQNQKAVNYLVHALYMSEIAPEVFEEN